MRVWWIFDRVAARALDFTGPTVVNSFHSAGRPSAQSKGAMNPRDPVGRGDRRYSKRPAWGTILLLLLLLFLAARWGWEPGMQAPAPPESLDEGLYAVRRVVDGDTLLMADGVRLRLIGIDCPESVKPDSPVEPFGPESSQFTRAFIGERQVRLQFDREREDRYGRKLAYVFVGEQMLNEELLRAGLARYLSHLRIAEPMKRRFRVAQNEARQARRGIWSLPPESDTCSGRP